MTAKIMEKPKIKPGDIVYCKDTNHFGIAIRVGDEVNIFYEDGTAALGIIN